MRGVQTLAPQQGADITIAPARIGFANDAQLVLGGESPPLGAFSHFRIRGQLASVPTLYTNIKGRKCLTDVGTEGLATAH